jgi:hypothetical protein
MVPTPGADSSQRLRRFCTTRLPKVADRLSKAVARLSGDAETKGSIAALEQRITRATEAGNQAAADLLKILLDHRTQRLPMLRSTQQALDAWQHTYCTTS